MYARARGGTDAWTDELHAIAQTGWRTTSAILATCGGVKPNALPKRPEPPELGWQEKRADEEARILAKIRKRHQAAANALAANDQGRTE